MPKIVKATIGEREFAIQAVSLGTVRRVPQAFKVATDAIRRRDQAEGKEAQLPTPEEMEALMALVHDGIEAAAKKSGGPSMSIASFTELVDDLDMADGLVDLSRAVQKMFDGGSSSTVADAGATLAGNPSGSESVS